MIARLWCRFVLLLGLGLGLVAAGAAAAAPDRGGAPPESPWRFASDPAPSTYVPGPRTDTLIVGATVLDGGGGRQQADVLLRDGKIVSVGPGLARSAGLTIIEAAGRWLTPGLIDVHTHDGTYPLPQSGDGGPSDVTELGKPSAADTWIEHGVRPVAPAFGRALAGGVTTLQILPGSQLPFAGRTLVVKPVRAVTVQAMKFPGAPYGLKMACGENPKNSDGSFPTTRMGIVAAMREAFGEAQRYAEEGAPGRESGRGGGPGRGPHRPPRPDARMDTLAGVLQGEILVHLHCYRADDISTMLNVAREFGFQIAAVHHAAEAYKIAGELREAGTCAAVWPDWWGYKHEAEDAIPENAAFIDAAGACAMMHSDIPLLGDRLNVEAAKAAAAGRRAGLDIPPEHAIRWITSNPARALGLADRIGRIAPGMNADLVIWSGDPFSVYTHIDQVFIDGSLAHDRLDTTRDTRPDFELGRPAMELPR